MPLFRSRNTETLETVGKRLVDARAAVEARQRELEERAVDAAVSENPAERLAPYLANLAAAEAVVRALEIAEAELQRRERQRKAEAIDAAEKSRRRAIQGHAASAAKAGDAITAGLRQAIAGWCDLVRAGEKIDRLLKPSATPGDPGERVSMFGFSHLSIMLANMVNLETARLGLATPDTMTFPLIPKTLGNFGGLLLHGQHATEAPALADMVRKRFDITAVASRAADKPSAAAPPVVEGGTPPSPQPDYFEAKAAEAAFDRAASPITAPEPPYAQDAIDAAMERVRALAAGEMPFEPPEPAEPELSDAEVAAFQAELAASALAANEGNL